MQNQFGIIQMIQQGYYATYPLILISIVCLAVIFERMWALRGIGSRATKTADALVGPLRQGKFNEALQRTETGHTAADRVFHTLISGAKDLDRARLEELDEERRFAELVELKRYIWVLATSGASAPFIGLFGTVVGILVAFQSMAVMGTGGFSVVAAGISEALISTALGSGGRDHRGHFLQLLLGQDRKHQRRDPHQCRPSDRRRAAGEARRWRLADPKAPARCSGRSTSRR